MIPKTNDVVKLYLSNNLLITGKVLHWNDNNIVLSDKQGIFVLKDIKSLLAYWILSSQQTTQELLEQQVEIKEKIEEVKALPSEHDLRIAKLAELRKLEKQAEIEILSKKMKEHQPTTSGMTKYELPTRFYKKQGA